MATIAVNQPDSMQKSQGLPAPAPLRVLVPITSRATIEAAWANEGSVRWCNMMLALLDGAETAL